MGVTFRLLSVILADPRGSFWVGSPNNEPWCVNEFSSWPSVVKSRIEHGMCFARSKSWVSGEKSSSSPRDMGPGKSHTLLAVAEKSCVRQIWFCNRHSLRTLTKRLHRFQAQFRWWIWFCSCFGFFQVPFQLIVRFRCSAGSLASLKFREPRFIVILRSRLR